MHVDIDIPTTSTLSTFYRDTSLSRYEVYSMCSLMLPHTIPDRRDKLIFRNGDITVTALELEDIKKKFFHTLLTSTEEDITQYTRDFMHCYNTVSDMLLETRRIDLLRIAEDFTTNILPTAKYGSVRMVSIVGEVVSVIRLSMMLSNCMSYACTFNITRYTTIVPPGGVYKIGIIVPCSGVPRVVYKRAKVLYITTDTRLQHRTFQRSWQARNAVIGYLSLPPRTYISVNTH